MMTNPRKTSGVPLPSLLAHIATSAVPDLSISGLSLDSRKTAQGDLFLALDGKNTSGVKFIRQAINSGAVAIAVEQDSAARIFEKTVPVIPVQGLRANAGVIAARFFGQPSAEMNVTGITGTNGKTSVAWFVTQALTRLHDVPAGLIGTLGSGQVTQMLPGLNTTPDPVSLQAALAELVRQGTRDVVIEVTSIGLDQARVAGINFNTGIFTNLSPDHLDYHGTMDAYGAVKKTLFTDYGLRHAVVNLDDAFGRQLAKELQHDMPVYGYSVAEGSNRQGLSTETAVLASVAEFEQGMTLKITSPWGSGAFDVPVVGHYNASNLLASLACLCLSDIPFATVIELLAGLQPVPGRMEMFGGGDSPLVIVDYAHTPDALEKVLQVINRKQHKKVFCVFGCGGDRDTPKRPQMGAIAEKLSDVVILTNDNPRGEDPTHIIEDILSGIHDRSAVQTEKDRRKAIELAIHTAAPGDIVLVAGKGHESYQEIEGTRFPFSDQQVIRNLLGETQ